ncbi:hypothetical protein DVH24_026526 [Malus domestica]|uniref:Uncharacterized protein n=1 Tax=Malus domestica TaxID=3750 RepID=A0A498KGD1_MALDO|nr:hypothetical protein DVH24_026526 [Malus domestica]
MILSALGLPFPHSFVFGNSRAISQWHEAFWELTGFGFHRNSEVKRVRAREILGWVTHWEVLV